MASDRASIQPGNTPVAASKLRLLTLDQLDHRTAAAKRCRDLIAAIELDLGGSDRLSTGERQIIQRAAIIGAVLEDIETRWLAGEPIDPALYATLGNAQRRLLETIGLRRRARDVTPSVDEYVARLNGEAAT